MKTTISFLLTAVLLSSCANTWDSEVKDMFHQSCMEDAADKAISEKHAKAYCDCTLEKIMEKYPKYEEALAKIDSISVDPKIQQCKQGNFK
jgi:hypothetical protein